MDPTWGQALDQALVREEARVPAGDRWLFYQTALTGPARRAWMAGWPPPAAGAWVDWGTAYGALAVEVAHQYAMRVYGVDWSRARLSAAARWEGAVPHRGQVWWTEADALSFSPPEPVVGMSARFLLQHLPDPAGALAHWAAVLEPGGALFVEDVDDGWTVEHPAPPPAWAAVVEALSRLQRDRGGDRQIGRRLPELVTAAGLELADTALAVQGARVSSEAFRLSRQLEVLRMEGERDALLAGGYLTREAWQEGVSARASASGPVFMSAGTLRLRAVKPPASSAPPSRQISPVC